MAIWTLDMRYEQGKEIEKRVPPRPYPQILPKWTWDPLPIYMSKEGRNAEKLEIWISRGLTKWSLPFSSTLDHRKLCITFSNWLATTTGILNNDRKYSGILEEHACKGAICPPKEKNASFHPSKCFSLLFHHKILKCKWGVATKWNHQIF